MFSIYLLMIMLQSELLRRLNERMTIVMVSHDVGFVSQTVGKVICVRRTVAVHPTSKLTGRLIAELYGVPRRQRVQNAERLLDALGLADRKKQKARALSKGLRQRLMLCTALVTEPEILFLDEPTSGLDVQSARVIRNLVREQNRKGLTVFLTTHNMWEAEELCHRIAIINRGRLAAVSTPRELKDAFTRLRVVEVEFEGDFDEAKLSEALGCRVDVFGGKCRARAEDVSEAICNIVDYARTRGLKIVSLNVVQPSLEEIFLEIVGRG